MTYDLTAWRWDRTLAGAVAADPALTYAAIAAKRLDLGVPIRAFGLAEILGALCVREPRELDDLPFDVELGARSPDEVLWATFSFAGGREREAGVIERLAQRLDAIDLVLYDPQTASLAEPSRPLRLALDVEGGEKIYSPTLADLEEALAGLDPGADRSIVILESWRGDFVQVAGSRTRLTVEWRDSAGHWIAGRRGERHEGDEVIETASGVVAVRSSEVLTHADALVVLSNFFADARRSEAFSWRARS